MRSSITEAHVVAVMDDGNGGQRLHFFEDDVSLEQDIERPFDTDIGVEKFGISNRSFKVVYHEVDGQGYGIDSYE